MSVTLQNKKKLSVGIAAVAAAAITLGAGTYAFFSSTGSDHTTTASAGTLQLGDTNAQTITLSPMAPGDGEQKDLTFSNGGSLTGNLTLAFKLTNNNDNGCSGDEKKVDQTCDVQGDAGELPGYLHVVVTKDNDPTELYTGTLAGLVGNGLSSLSVVPNQSVIYHFAFELPNTPDPANGGTNPDNAVQGDSVTLTTTATLKQ